MLCHHFERRACSVSPCCSIITLLCTPLLLYHHFEMHTCSISTCLSIITLRGMRVPAFEGHVCPAFEALELRRCSHLSSGLVNELEYKHRLVRALAAQGRRGRTRFISAEGCYSQAAATTRGLRIKFAAKAFADWSDDLFFYVADGAVRKCPLPSQAG